MRNTAAFLLVSVLVYSSLNADEPKGGPKAFEHLKYRNIGPAVGGRVCRAAGVPGDPLTYYAATASGGMWKSGDGGKRWVPIMDDMPTSTIGSFAVALSDPNVLYAGSGEANIRGNVEVGNGLYRSTDAGKTWKHVWKQEGQIGTVIVHPKDPDIAFAAVLGKAFGPNPERGVYRTTDGGKAWKRVLFQDADTGASDICFDPNNPRILFAGLWQTRRKPWEMTSGGPGSGLHVSRDGGDTWTRLVAPPKDDGTAKAGTKHADGLPEGIWGKIGLAVAPSDSKRVYALIEADKGGLFRSDDGGVKWDRVNSSRAIQQRGWYFSTIAVHPRNADVLFFPQVPLLKSIDGGKTLTRIKGPHHGDHHDFWIDPKNPDRMIDSNDGGVDISTDGGKSWYAPPLPICQTYHIATDNRTPYHIACSIQDIGTAMGPSHSLDAAGIPMTHWHGVGGGEAGHVAIDPTDPNIVYATEYGGYLTRYDHRTRQAKSIGIYPFNASGHGADALRYRFQWTAPVLISPHDPKLVYHAANVLFATRNAGKTWTVISKDLTRNDKAKQKWSGGPITGDNTGVEVYGTIFALAESPKKKGLLWAGSDDGLVHVSPDGGKTWDDVTAGLTKAGLPEWATITCVEVSPHDADTAYVVADAHRLDDRKPYLFVTTDLGKSWKSLAAKLPEEFLQVVRVDPIKKDMLYLGSEKGVTYSTDAGATWTPLKLNLPTVRITDLILKDGDLVVGTNGRSIWILDDLTPLRAPADDGKEARLYVARPVVRYCTTGEIRPAMPMNAGDNPPRGATLHYRLPAKPKGEVKLEILDGDDKVLRTLTSKKPSAEEPDLGAYSDEEVPKLLPTAPGLHRFVWDLRHEGARTIRKARVDSGDPKVGPLVDPGTYTIRLTVDGKPHLTKVEVRLDSRQKDTADLPTKAQITLALKIRDELSTLTDAVEQLRSVRKQLLARDKLLGADAKALGDASKALQKKLDALEEDLHNPKAEVAYDILAQKGGAKLYSQLAWLFDLVKDTDGEPTQGIVELHEDHAKALKKGLARWVTLVEKDLAALNAQAKKLDVPGVMVPGKGERN
jgi:photosystem II stability/assembly factor-like uncharacterized protein